MKFNIGDRVRSVEDHGPALRIGETGTVIGTDFWGDPLVQWDEYHPDKHSSDGEVPDGHGWFIGEGWIERIEICSDLGELPTVGHTDMTKFLFDT